MAVRNTFATLLKFIMAAVFASLLLNAHAQAMPSDCHTAEVSVSTTHGPLASDPDHHDKAFRGKLCCSNACVVCVANIPSPVSVAWSDYIGPSYFPVMLTRMTGQDAPAVFEPPRSIPL